MIATGLDATRIHSLEIEPVLQAGEEFRLETLRGRPSGGGPAGRLTVVYLSRQARPVLGGLTMIGAGDVLVPRM